MARARELLAERRGGKPGAVYLITDRTRRAFSWKRANPLGAFKHVSLNPQIRPLLFMFLLYQIAFFVYPIIWSYFATARFEWSESTIGLSLAFFGISMALVPRSCHLKTGCR